MTSSAGVTRPVGGASSRTRRIPWHWLLWFVASGSLAAYFMGRLRDPGADRRLFLPGNTSDGHYQIEVKCDACHTAAFGGRDDMQTACQHCHAKELEAVNDSHPRSKFTDPRNADRVARLDARYCVTCHVEHRPDATLQMGVTLPEDYCFSCHENVAEDRSSHEGLAFDSCADGACHNFHDNRALYEDFLTRSLDQPDHLPEARLPVISREVVDAPAVDRSAADAPDALALSADELNAWAGSAHGRSGVNCSGCHQTKQGWQVETSLEKCASCHQRQTAGFRTGRHGMRTAQGLSAMQVGAARRPMHEQPAAHAVSCNACHAAHESDTRTAAVQACLGCHDDDHSRAYLDSKHARAWWAETLGSGGPGTGVSCATCHLPRHEDETGTIYVQHNQNDNLRPNEKMVRSVCKTCHGVGFSLDALADASLVQSNFGRPPASHAASLDMVRARAAP